MVCNRCLKCKDFEVKCNGCKTINCWYKEKKPGIKEKCHMQARLESKINQNEKQKSTAKFMG